MLHKQQILLALLLCGSLSSLTGCMSEEELKAMTQKQNASGQNGSEDFGGGHEGEMRRLWVDKPYRELVASRGGKHGVVMDIPRYGWPASSAVVYGADPATGCIDAFLVLHDDEEPVIKDYFCR